MRGAVAAARGLNFPFGRPWQEGEFEAVHDDDRKTVTTSQGRLGQNEAADQFEMHEPDDSTQTHIAAGGIPRTTRAFCPKTIQS